MSLVDRVRFVFECPMAWEKLTRLDGSTLHCDVCAKSVTDLSALTRDEAEAFLAANRGAPVCVRLVRDRSGRSVHAAAPRGAVAALATAVIAAGCATSADDTADSAFGDTSRVRGAPATAITTRSSRPSGSFHRDRPEGGNPVLRGSGEGAAARTDTPSPPERHSAAR